MCREMGGGRIEIKACLPFTVSHDVTVSTLQGQLYDVFTSMTNELTTGIFLIYLFIYLFILIAFKEKEEISLSDLSVKKKKKKKKVILEVESDGDEAELPPTGKNKEGSKGKVAILFHAHFLPDLRVTFTFGLPQDNTRVTFIHKSQSSFTYFHVSLCPNHAHFFTHDFT